MKTKYYLILILCLQAIYSSAQKSRVLSVFQLIESEKYEEAKEAIELAIWNDKTSRWPRTYYAKGLLCQTAFEAGFKENNSKKMRVYPDQLFVGYEAYEKALKLDKRGRIHSAVASQYYNLANDFQKLGRKHFQNRDYSESLNAFEHALLVSRSPLLSVEIDTGLVYNTAMAAYESRDWDKAIGYLSELNEESYSPETALLLYRAYAENGDSAAGKEILTEGVERYDSEEKIVLQLVDILVNENKKDSAVKILDSANIRHPENHIFPWTRGLIFQGMERYNEAIESFLLASRLAPSEVRIYYSLGICYYNMGVEITESARLIRNNTRYKAARQDAREHFLEALNWLEMAFEKDPADQKTISRLYQLYYQLQMDEKRKTMELLMKGSKLEEQR